MTETQAQLAAKMFDVKERIATKAFESRKAWDAGLPDPHCRVCHGDGTYYEDVAGDGGSQMQMACDCVNDDQPDDQD